MRGARGVLAVVFAATVMLCVHVPAAWASDSYEPNNSVYTAVGPQMAGASLTSWVSAENDEDWYWFYVDRSTTVHIFLQEPAKMFYEVSLKGPGTNGSYLASDNNCDYWNWLPSAQIDYTVSKAGYYYMSVDSYLGGMGGYDVNNPYVLSLSGDFITKPPAILAKPVAPAKMSRKKTYRVYALLKPEHAVGSYPVQIYKYKKVSGKWKSYGFVRASAADYANFTKCSCSMKLSSGGKWRLRAYAPQDDVHSAVWSGYTYVTVK